MRLAAAAVAVFALTSARAARAEDAIVTLPEVLAAAAAAPATRALPHEIAAADALVDAASGWPAPAVRVETNRLTAHLVAGASLPLPVFGTIGAAKREAEGHARVVRTEAELMRRETARRAALTWVALARADGVVAAAGVAAGQAAELETIARGRLDAGVGADVDVTTAHAARARADLDAVAAKRALEATSAELAGALGWDPSRVLHAGGALPTGDAVALDGLRSRLTGHPERAAAVERVNAATATVGQVRSLWLPSLAVEGQVSVSDPTTPGTDILVGVALEIPVFSRIGARVRSAESTETAERARLAATELELGAVLVAAFRRWQAAGERLGSLERDVLPAQERAAKLSAQAYREGARELATAIQAERDLAAVVAEVNGARADLAAAWVELELAAGDPPGGTGAR